MFLRLEWLLLIFDKTVPAIGGQWGNVVWWGMYVKIGAQRLRIIINYLRQLYWPIFDHLGQMYYSILHNNLRPL